MPETPKIERIRVSVEVPKDLHMKFRLLCVQQKQNMNGVMLKLLAEYLKNADTLAARNPRSQA